MPFGQIQPAPPMEDGMDFATSPAHDALVREVTALASPFSLDYWREKDRTETYPGEFVNAFAAAGWFGTIVPREYGGRGLGVTEAALLLHAICASGAGTSGASPIHLAIFPPYPLITHGSSSLKARYLPELATGALSLSFGVTEAEAGTDTSRIATTAARHGGGWRINGAKAWISNGQHAQKVLLLARTSSREAQRHFAGL